MEDLIDCAIKELAYRPSIGPGSETTPEFQITMPSMLAEQGLPFQSFADAFARQVAERFLSGQLGFDQADNAIGWLHGYALTGPHDDLLDGFAWQVYRAFDAWRVPSNRQRTR